MSKKSERKKRKRREKKREGQDNKKPDVYKFIKQDEGNNDSK